MDDQSAPWYRSIRKAAREWAGTYPLDSAIYPLLNVKADLFGDICGRQRELLTPAPYSKGALRTYQSKIIADLWFVTGSDLKGVFKAKRYLVLPSAAAVINRWPSVTDVLMRIPGDDDDAYYRDLFVDCLQLGLHRRIVAAENALRSVAEWRHLLAEQVAQLPPERRTPKWSPTIFAD